LFGALLTSTCATVKESDQMTAER